MINLKEVIDEILKPFTGDWKKFKNIENQILEMFQEFKKSFYPTQSIIDFNPDPDGVSKGWITIKDYLLNVAPYSTIDLRFQRKERRQKSKKASYQSGWSVNSCKSYLRSLMNGKAKTDLHLVDYEKCKKNRKNLNDPKKVEYFLECLKDWKYAIMDGGHRHRLLTGILSDERDSYYETILKELSYETDLPYSTIIQKIENSVVWISFYSNLNEVEIHEQFVLLNYGTKMTMAELRNGMKTDTNEFKQEMRREFSEVTNLISGELDRLIEYCLFISSLDVSKLQNTYTATDVDIFMKTNTDKSFFEKCSEVIILCNEIISSTHSKMSAIGHYLALFNYVYTVYDTGKSFNPEYYKEFLSEFGKWFMNIRKGNHSVVVCGVSYIDWNNAFRGNLDYMKYKKELYFKLLNNDESVTLGHNVSQYLVDNEVRDEKLKNLLNEDFGIKEEFEKLNIEVKKDLKNETVSNSN